MIGAVWGNWLSHGRVELPSLERPSGAVETLRAYWTQNPLGFVWVTDNDITVQSAARSPATLHGGGSRLYDGDKVVHDSVRDGFVKDAFIAKPLKIHFQTLQFDAHFVRNVGKDDRPVIRLSRFGADRSKLGAMMFDSKISCFGWVVKNFQRVTKVRCVTQR